MTKKKTETAKNEVRYISYGKRAEVNGQVYKPNEETDLAGLSFDQIAHVVGMGYYGVLNPEALSPELDEAIKDIAKG